MLMLENVSVIQGLIANKALILRGGKKTKQQTTKRQTTNNQTKETTNDKTTVTLFLRAPLVAIGAQKP